MTRKIQPHRVTLWKGEEIDYKHMLSDGFGIPAVVTYCPCEKRMKRYSGKDEYGDRVKGTSFDDCVDCEFFQGFGFGQEIYCAYGMK
jgi:hypothetical protein